MKRVIILFNLWLFVLISSAQPCKPDSLIPDKEWEHNTISDGIVVKSVTTNLFDSFQAIYVAEIDTTIAEVEFGISVPDTLLQTSIISENVNAILAINGTFFNMKQGGNCHFISIGDEIVSFTEEREFDTRATGIFMSEGKSISIARWNRDKENCWSAKSKYAMVSGPLFIDDNIDIFLWDNEFVKKRHPRSFIGSTKTGKILLVVVDGRQPEYAEGMSLFELRLLARSLGCTDALNLDGGGSSTLYVNGLGVVNKPSDLSERPVASILYVKLKNKFLNPFL